MLKPTGKQPPAGAEASTMSRPLETDWEQEVFRLWLCPLLFSLICLLTPGMAAATVIYTYSGHIGRIEYNGTASSTSSPFTQGEAVSAEITVPGLTSGHFSVVGSQLFVNGIPVFGSGLGSGYVQFGSAAERILFAPGNVQSAIAGNFPEAATDPLIESAQFCCDFRPPWFNGQENGQAVFNGHDFWALYLPTGLSNINVTAFGTGVWSARVIPEPASAGMFVLALMGLLGIAGGLHRRTRRHGASGSISAS